MSSDNSALALEAIHNNMMAILEKETEQSCTEAGDIATKLLTQPDLPMLYRVRSHIVLAYGQHHYLWHARKAIELIEVGRARFGRGDTPGELRAFDRLFNEAQYVLHLAEADSAELETVKAELEAEGRTVWEPGMDEEDCDVEGRRSYEGKRPIPEDYYKLSTTTELQSSTPVTAFAAPESAEIQPSVATDQGAESEPATERAESQVFFDDEGSTSAHHVREVRSPAAV